VLIGGQARARNLALMTRNVQEFERIKDLAIETW
jgi:tRNA(fMet)-specific endonuclease VapC